MAGNEQKLMEVLKYIHDFQDQNSYPPSVREICQGLNIRSTASVYQYIEKLTKRGYIKKSANKNRAIEIVKGEFSTVKKEGIQIPLVGKITAGIPIEAIEDIEDIYSLPAELFPRGELFMLKVSGDSMINAGIQNGDKIVMKRQNTAENGQIVAALIDGDATVKRFYRTGQKYILRPENPEYDDIVTYDIQILGVLVGLIRTFK